MPSPWLIRELRRQECLDAERERARDAWREEVLRTAERVDAQQAAVVAAYRARRRKDEVA